jgi:hypothetical protein
MKDQRQENDAVSQTDKTENPRPENGGIDEPFVYVKHGH